MLGDHTKTESEDILKEIITNIAHLEQQQNELFLTNCKICRIIDRQKAIYSNILELLMESNPNYDLNLKSSPNTLKVALQDLVESSIRTLNTCANKTVSLVKEVELLENDWEQVLLQKQNMENILETK